MLGYGRLGVIEGFDQVLVADRASFEVLGINVSEKLYPYGVGQVIGIASAKASDGESMGFAIPINVVKPIIAQIIEKGSFERVYLGINAIGIEQQSSVSKEALKEYYGSDTGIYVANVAKGGGADKAGLQERDVILEVNGTKVGTMNKMYSLLVSFKSGDTVHVKYLRNGQ